MMTRVRFRPRAAVAWLTTLVLTTVLASAHADDSRDPGPAAPAAPDSSQRPGNDQAATSTDTTRPWRIVAGASQPDATGIITTTWTQSRAPLGAHNRIRVHRYRGTAEPFASLLYLPGTNMNGVSVIADETHNLWLFLANRGVEVFTLDYRTRAIHEDTPIDTLDMLRDWTTGMFLSDIDSAITLVRRHSVHDRPFLAGFSRGALLAYATALEKQQLLSGLVILDGSFKSNTPTASYDAEEAIRQLAESGLWASDIGGSRGWAARQKLMQAAMNDPTAPSPSPDHATVGELVAHVLQNAWGPGGLANPQGGVSQPQVLATLLQEYDRYYPAIQDIEGKSIADHDDDPRTTIDDRWGSLDLPIIAFATTGPGNAWVRDVVHSARTSGSSNVSIHLLDGYGHLDLLVADQAHRTVYEPILAWLHEQTSDVQEQENELPAEPVSTH